MSPIAKLNAWDRLRTARLKAGFPTAKSAADRFGFNPVTYRSHERAPADNGRGFDLETARAYARAFKVTAGWLMTGEGEARPHTIPVVGYVGAATQLFGFDDHAQGAGLDDIEAPPGVPDNAVAVIVRGDSGYPAIRDGMILVYWDKREDPTDLVGEDCFVKVSDGRTLVKILERGSAPDLWTLVSINATVPPIRDVRVEWAAPIEMRLRRANWRAGG